jgi:very-short-patch-repair endonuclease
MVGNHKADFYWRRAGVIVELDGYPYHSGRAAFERDHERDFAHQDAGLLVMRVTGRQVRSRPELFLVRLTRALALRSR